MDSFTQMIKRLTAIIITVTLVMPPQQAQANPVTAAPISPVTLVLDAHASLEAQQSIVRMLEELHSEGKLKGVLIEGAAGKLEAGRLLTFQEEHANRQFGNTLLSRGLIGAGLRFLMNHPGLPAYGVEDAVLYAENRNQFQKVMRLQAEIDPHLQRAEEKILSRQDKFSAGARAALALTSLRDMRADDFAKIQQVMADAMAWTGIDWNDLTQQTRWPNLMRLWQLWQETRLPAPEEGKEHEDFRQALEEAYLSPEANPGTLRFLGLRALQQEIEPVELFNELETLKEEIIQQAGLTKAEKHSLRQLERIRFIRQALMLELSREDSEKFYDFLLQPGSFLAVKKILKSEIWKRLMTALQDVQLFYAGARFREEAIYEQIRAQLDTPGEGTWAVITGGYHEEGLAGRLEAEGLKVEVRLPEFDGQNDKWLYRRLMSASAGRNTLALPQVAAMRDPSRVQTMIGADEQREMQSAVAIVRSQIPGTLRTEPAAPAALAMSEVRNLKPGHLNRRAFLAAAGGFLAGGQVLAQEIFLGQPSPFPGQQAAPQQPVPVQEKSEQKLLIRPGDIEERLSLVDEKTRLAYQEVIQRMYEAATLGSIQYDVSIDYRNNDENGRPTFRLSISPRDSYENAAVSSLFGMDPSALLKRVYDDAMRLASGRQATIRGMANTLIDIEYLRFRERLDLRVAEGRNMLVDIQIAYERQKLIQDARARAEELVKRIREKEGVVADALDVVQVERTAELYRREEIDRQREINTSSADLLKLVSRNWQETSMTIEPEHLLVTYWPPEWRWVFSDEWRQAPLKERLAKWKSWARLDSFNRLFGDLRAQNFTGTHFGYRAALKGRQVAYLSTEDIYRRRIAQSDFGIIPGIVNFLFGRTGPYSPRNAEVNAARTNVERMNVVLDGLRREADTTIRGYLDEIEAELLKLELLREDIEKREKLIAEYEAALSDPAATKLQALVRDKPELDLAAELEHLTEDRVAKLKAQANVAHVIFKLKALRALAIDPQYSRPRAEAEPNTQPRVQPQTRPDFQQRQPQQTQPEELPHSLEQPTPIRADDLDRDPQPFQQRPLETHPQGPALGTQQPSPIGPQDLNRAPQPLQPRTPAPTVPQGQQPSFPAPPGEGWRWDPVLKGYVRPLPPQGFYPRRSEIRQASSQLAVDAALAYTHGLLAPGKAEALLPLLQETAAQQGPLLDRMLSDLPGVSLDNLQRFVPAFSETGEARKAYQDAPVLFIRAALFDRAPVKYFVKMARSGMPLVVVFEPEEASIFAAVQQKMRDLPADAQAQTFFVLAKDGAPALTTQLLSRTSPAAAERFDVSGVPGSSFFGLMAKVRGEGEGTVKREAAFLGTEQRDTRRVPAAEIPYRFFYNSARVSAAEWDYRLEMVDFLLRHSGHWKDWARETPRDLKDVLGHIMSRLSAELAQSKVIDAAA